ncbi:hypothetical protein [Zoogloea sp.]|uniref:hypothetical protein n=1 Tax=Zoogloea sp. TaxID=49181 RepID=UPI0035B4D0EE
MRLARILLTVAALLAPGLSKAELVLVASARSAGIELNHERAENLYLGNTTTLADGTPVKLIDLPNGMLRDDFYLKLTGKNPAQIRAYWSRQVFTGRALPPREAGSVAEARQWLTDIPNLIGYLERSDVPAGARILLRFP